MIRARRRRGRTWGLAWPLAIAALTLSCSGKSLRVGSSAGFGPPETIVRGLLQPPATLASDGTSLYWVDFAGSGVWRVSVGGGTPERIAGDAVGWAFVHVDATRVYYVGADGIDAVPKAGGAPALLFPASHVAAAAVAGDVVYWLEEDSAPAPPHAPVTRLRSGPLGGGGATTLAVLPGPSTWVAVGVTATEVFIAENGDLSRVPVAGGPRTRVSATLSCESLLGNDDGVYCGQSPLLGNPPLVDVTSGGAVRRVAPTTSNPRSLASDADGLFWVDDADLGGGVVSQPAGGGAAVHVTDDPGCVAVAVDAAAVYWSERTGVILRASK